MSQTVERRPVHRPVSPARGGPASPLVPGLTAAGWAVGAGLIVVAFPVLLAWATDSRSGAGAAQALRTAGQLWLVANGGSVGAFGLVPLGLLALPLALLARAGGHGARTQPPADLRAGLLLLVAVALPYAVTAAVVAGLCASPSATPSPVRVLGTALLVGLAGTAVGIARQSRLHRTALALLPARVRTLARATTVALLALLGAGALLAASTLGVHGSRATALARSADPGLVGGLALLLMGLAVLPNLAVWGASWLVGPGFSVGVGTGVGPFGVVLGRVPALPVLAGLPTAAPPPWVWALALLVPVAAGCLAGLLLARRTQGGVGRVACETLLVLPAAGIGAALLALLSGGPLGPGRLAAVGPSPWQVGLATALEIGLPAVAVAALVAWRR